MPQPQLPPDLGSRTRHERPDRIFAKYAPSHRVEYLRWIDEAERGETRESLIARR